LDAFFNVYKPKGPTSHDVVARLRRASGVKRIGHAGTLDPLAEGVLVVAVGQATRAIEYLADLDKAYRADVAFGVETDTYDAEGRVVAERSISHLRQEDIEAALVQFRGRITQRPPAYSAVSVGGRRLYDLARQGQPVEAPVREVDIARLDLERWAPPVATLLVECSKGTYIRSLAHDLGAALGVGAHLIGLVRLRVGGFLAHNAVSLAELEEQLRGGTWQAAAIPPDAALAHLPAVHLDEPAARRLTNGMPVAGGSSANASGQAAGGPLARALAPDGRFLGIVRREVRDSSLVFRPEKVFVSAEPPGSVRREEGKQ
jgi:tRNA pseudouridine55 synthase